MVAIVGNNFPDGDMLYAALALPGRLGYLLHHRGHTHTLLFALAVGVVVGWFAQRYLKKRLGKKLLAWDTRAVWAVALGSPVLHIVSDFANNYGVHPFWPFWNGWVYGDTLFIIEPLLLATLFPVAYFAMKRRAYKWVGEVFFVALLTLIWMVPFVRWYSALFYTVFAVGVLAVGYRAKPKWRADFSLVLALLIVTSFSLVSRVAKTQVANANAEMHPSSKLHDVILSPFPANPFCWQVITVETLSDPSSRYRVRRGIFAPFPKVVQAASCPNPRGEGTTTVKFSPVGDTWGPQFRWEGQHLASITDMKVYREYSCEWEGVLRFARAPFVQEEENRTWAGDVRYDFEPGLGFAELEATADRDACRGWMPPWIPPRADIFN